VGSIPAFLLRQLGRDVIVELFDPTVGVWSAPAPMRLVVDERPRARRGSGPHQADYNSVFLLGPIDCGVSVGTRLRLPDGRRGVVYVAVRHDAGPSAPNPSHLEIGALVVDPMMAMTSVSILRGTTVDAYGDTLDTDTPIATHVPASITFTSTSDTTEETGRQYQVNDADAEVPPGTDIRVGDRLLDENTGLVFVVRGVEPTPNAFLPLPIGLSVRLVQD
jgi:hypothetical protein